MNKNILVIQGGGRAKGNTARLVESFKAGAEESGHSVEVVSLLRNEVKGCLGCNACRYGKPCVQKDAFHDLVPKIKAADFAEKARQNTLHVNSLLFGEDDDDLDE